MKNENKRKFFNCATLFILLIASAPAWSFIYIMPTDEEIVDRSPVIVYGVVGPSSPGPVSANGMVTTDFTFQIEENLKNFPNTKSIVVRQLGGILPDGSVQFIVGLPRLQEGNRMLLFLSPTPKGDAYETVGLAAGIFQEHPGSRGKRFLVRNGPAATRHSRPLTSPHLSAPFRSWIQDYIIGKRRAADYFSADPLDEPVSVVSEYNLLKSICQDGSLVDTNQLQDPEAKGSLMRQGRLDRWIPIEFVVQSDGQPHLQGGALNEVWKSMAVWNEDPNSQVRLSMRLSHRRNSELYIFDDGLSTITFESPHLSAPHQGLASATVRVRCDMRADKRPNEPALEIVEVDITTFKGFGTWLSDYTHDPLAYFTETMTHEIGHALGIDHSCSYDPETWTPEALASVMRPWSNPEEDPRTINEDDRAAAHHLYPMSGTEEKWIENCPWDDPQTLCLGEQQYKITAKWTTSKEGNDWQPAIAEPITLDAGYFYFFDPQNPELFIKVLDGCAINGHRWVFAAGMTDVGASFHVTELSTGRERLYRKSKLGKLMPTVTDTQAFPCDDAQTSASSSAALHRDNGNGGGREKRECSKKSLSALHRASMGVRPNLYPQREIPDMGTMAEPDESGCPSRNTHDTR